MLASVYLQSTNTENGIVREIEEIPGSKRDRRNPGINLVGEIEEIPGSQPPWFGISSVTNY